MLKKDIIKVKIDLRVSRSGSKEVVQRNKGLIFQLPKENIDMLFDNIFTYTTDKYK